MKDSLKLGAAVIAGAGLIAWLKKKAKSGITGIGATRHDLIAKYDSRRMFYGKATVEETPTYLKLWSYDTMVATYNKNTGVFKVLPSSWAPYGTYTQTTNRHIAEFARQCGVDLPRPIRVGTY